RRWGWEDKAVRQEAVTAIEEEIHHLREMTNQLLALAAIDREALEETGVVSASEIARRVAQKWKRLYPGFKWTLALDHASATRVRISEVRLEQVFRALLDNARKYTQPEGAIRIEVARRGEIVSIVIQDSGEGIPAEDLPHVTERFYRADKARSRQEGGIGLGLAICREIVERFRGRLIITSSGEDGTRVEVVLPGVEGEGEGESEG
ncbi:MAG: sensor histidine kinase, partial [Bacilli bacterium]